LPKTPQAQLLGRQLVRSGTSVASNYRAACRGRSRAEFVSKLSIVVEEADETLFWLELIRESSSYSGKFPDDLEQEAKELLYFFSSSRKSAKVNETKKSQINKSRDRQIDR
jgi:four helix bundle protein